MHWLKLPLFLLITCSSLRPHPQEKKQEHPSLSPFSSQVVDTIHRSETFPGLKGEEFAALKPDLIQLWDTLVKEGVVEITAPDQQVRPLFVTLQAIVEQTLAAHLGNQIPTSIGMIHTPLPATPLCTAGAPSPELVDPSIAADPARLFTVQARTTILRDYLSKKGGALFVIYPKGGLEKRTKEQQAIYQTELKNHPNLIDRPLENCTAIPDELIGATYVFKDNEGGEFIFAIHMTQANDPKEMGHFGLWFGSVKQPAVLDRLKAVTDFFSELGEAENCALENMMTF